MKKIVISMLGILSINSFAVNQFKHMVEENKILPPNWYTSIYTDSAKKHYTGDQLLTIAMPCGGIGAGQLYIRGDGSLARWWMMNNAVNTGYGIEKLKSYKTLLGEDLVCYRTFKPKAFVEQNVTITVNGISKQLNEKDFDRISFVGEYPIAKFDYKNSKQELPVSVTAEVFSPFIPGNARSSAYPATVLSYTVTNTSQKNIDVDLTSSLENIVCNLLKNSNSGLLTNTANNNSVTFSIEKDPEAANQVISKKVVDNFDNLDFWNNHSNFNKAITTKAFAKQLKVNNNDGKFVNTYLNGDKFTGSITSKTFTIEKPYITFKVGGGRDGKNLQFNLLVDGKKIKTATGNNNENLTQKVWDVKKYIGKNAQLQIVDNSTKSWGHILVDSVKQVSGFNKEFPNTKHPYFGNLTMKVVGEDGINFSDANKYNNIKNETKAQVKLGQKLVGSVGKKFVLLPNESKKVSFIISWYFPNRPDKVYNTVRWTKLVSTGGPIIGNMYTNWFKNSQDVAKKLENDLPALTKETKNFVQTFYHKNNLPYWLKQQIMRSVSTLATETFQWKKNGRVWAWEGVGSCAGTCTHVWNYEHSMAFLFPELERNVREFQDFGQSFNKNGSIDTRNGTGWQHVDGQAGAVLKLYREYLNSSNDKMLRRLWPKAKRTIKNLISQDKNNDGLIEGIQPNTYDISFYGANTYVGSLYLAALKAGEKMANLVDDKSFAKKCARIAANGAKNSVKRLFNGDYFIQEVDRKKHPKHQYYDGCLSDQLFGQTWASILNLGYVYPKDKVIKTFNSIWKYNWTGDVSLQNNVHKPERYYARDNEKGLFICTWPKSKHLGKTGVRYRNEVWTGIEYQVATGMIYSDLMDSGLSIVKAVYDRYEPTKHNPWNEIECGDHYARAMASWGILLAVQDLFYNGPKQTIKFAPKMNKSDFIGFFTAAAGWGNIAQQRTGDMQINKITVKYGKVKLKNIIIDTVFKDKVIVKLNGKTIEATKDINKKDNCAIITLDKTVCIKAGDNFEVITK